MRHSRTAGSGGRPPCAVLIGGAPATGKSTLAGTLAPRLGAAVVDLDVATGPLTDVVAGLIGARDLGDPELARLTRAARYETLFALAESNLRAGAPVVLVAPFTAERTADGWRTVVERLGDHAAVLTLVWLHLATPALVGRLTRRGAARDTMKVRDPAAFLAGLDLDPPAAPHLALDAEEPVADLADQVLRQLARQGVAIDGRA